MKRVFAALLFAILPVFSATTVAAPEIGAAAPDFRLQDQNHEWHSLADYRGQWLVLYFYPKDDTPGCTTEACSFRDDIYRYKALNVALLGVSLDDTASHQAFAEKYSLPFPLLADTEKQVTMAYDALTRLGPVEFASRETFIIDPDGLLAKHYPDVDPETHNDEVLADLAVLMNPGAATTN